MYKQLHKHYFFTLQCRTYTSTLDSNSLHPDLITTTVFPFMTYLRLMSIKYNVTFNEDEGRISEYAIRISLRIRNIQYNTPLLLERIHLIFIGTA